MAKKTRAINKKILIIEDHPITVDMLMSFLERGYICDFALDGTKGLEKAASEKPDLILLDVMLPGIDGLEVCKKLKSNPDTANIPVIIESAKTTDEDIASGKTAGAKEYLTKPFELDKLLELIEKYI